MIVGQAAPPVRVKVGVQLDRRSAATEGRPDHAGEGRVVERHRLHAVGGRHGRHGGAGEQFAVAALRGHRPAVRALKPDRGVGRVGVLGAALAVDALQQVRAPELLGHRATGAGELFARRPGCGRPACLVGVDGRGLRRSPYALQLGAHVGPFHGAAERLFEKLHHLAALCRW